MRITRARRGKGKTLLLCGRTLTATGATPGNIVNQAIAAAFLRPLTEFVTELTGVEVGFGINRVAWAQARRVPLDFVATGDGAVADGGAFFVGGEEGCLLKTRP